MTSGELVDVAVIGAGPAGLAAVVTAADRGARCVLVDAGPGPGGQYWRRPPPPAVPGHAAAEETGPVHPSPGGHDDRARERWLRRLTAHADAGRIHLSPGHHVWTVTPAPDGYEVRAVDRSGPVPTQRLLRCRRLVLAPGAYDRQLPFPGWTLPGVMTAGGVQALLKGSGVLAGRRILVAGTGPFLLPVATDAAAAGADVVAICESSAVTGWLAEPGAIGAGVGKLGEAAGYVAALARHRIAYRRRHVVLAAHGTDAVEAVTVARLRPDGTVDPGSHHRITVDTLAVGWGFTPQLELPLALGCDTRTDVDGSLCVVVDDRQATTVGGVYVAGEASGVGGAALALVEGELAGGAVADDLADAHPFDTRRLDTRPGVSVRTARLARRRRALRRFAAAMHRAHPLPAGWIDRVGDDTTVCRCEEVRLSTLRRVVTDSGAGDTRTAKVISRAGMGWCQGRVCGFAVDALRTEWTGRPASPVAMATRPVATPVPLGSFLSDADPDPPDTTGTM